MIKRLRLAIRADLESPTPERRFGKGWLSGVGALVLGLAVLSFMLGKTFPAAFSLEPLRVIYQSPWFNPVLQAMMLLGFVLACLNMMLRQNKILGWSALVAIFTASILGESQLYQASQSQALLGLDWFALNLLMTGLLFIPLEKLFGRLREQALFRPEWRDDLLYFLVSSLFVQSLSYLSLLPSYTLLAHTQDWHGLRQAVASQPLWLQFIEIMVLTDFVQYWFHRAFHQIPALWRFHAIHHSAQHMDWLAGSRMHLIEVIALRGLTIIPMYLLGFAETAMHAYILMVYLYATFVHANVRFNVEFLKPIIVTPRFHHWHHGIEKEAIDVNFAIHFPWLDKLFGTYYMPPKQWPSGYGIGGHPVPQGYWKQIFYPFKK